MQPDQQQGLRIPPLSFESAFPVRILLVSAFLPDVTQQIHSLRARGVISSHTARAAGEATRTFRKSSGILCITPEAIPFINSTIPKSGRLGRYSNASYLLKTRVSPSLTISTLSPTTFRAD